MENAEPLTETPHRRRTATQRADRRWQRPLAIGIILAVGIHFAILLVTWGTRIPPTPFAAAGPRMGDIRAAAGGGSGLEMVEVQPQETPAEEPTPTPVPVPVPVEVVVRPREVVVEPVDDRAAAPPASLPGTGAPGTGGNEGTAAGPGTATGTGRGGGGTEEEGASGLIPPRPRGVFIPPSGRPASARGTEMTVWVFVTPAGRVAADSTRLEPATSDSKYNQRLKRTLAEYVFEPAKRDGRAVGAWFPFEIIL